MTTTATTITSYRKFKILVTHNSFTVLDRNSGEPVGRVTTMRAARSLVRELRRAEQAGT